MSTKDPDEAAMRRYASGIRAEEEKTLKDPAFHAAVAREHAEVAERREKNPELYNRPDHGSKHKMDVKPSDSGRAHDFRPKRSERMSKEDAERSYGPGTKRRS